MGKPPRRGTRDPLDSFSRRNPRVIQRFDRDNKEDDFRSPKNNNRESVLGKRSRRGDELRNARRTSQFRSVDDDDVDVDEVAERFKHGSIGDFISEEDEEEDSESGEDDDIFNKSKTQKPTPRASSPGGSDSYLSDTRYVMLFKNYKLKRKKTFFFTGFCLFPYSHKLG